MLTQTKRPSMATLMQNYHLKDEGDLLYTTLVGMVMAAIFATSLHKDVHETLTSMAPEGTSYPFPDHTREPAAVFASAVTGFVLGVTVWTIAGQIRWACVRKLLSYRGWLFNPRSTKTKAWALALKVLVPRRRLLYAFQHVLPKLPLPQLEKSCELLLRNTKPLLSVDEFNALKTDLELFKANEGPTLHEALQRRYEREENWLSEMWDKYAYFAYREPLAVNLNVSASSGINKGDLEYCETVKQVGRAAAMTYQFLRLNQTVKGETLHPILVQGIVPVCMDRYKYVFSCTRVPGEHMDHLETHADSKHIIINRRGRMYKLDVYAPNANLEETLLTPEELQTQLELIIRHADDSDKVRKNPSVLTGQKRSVWANERNKLKEDKINSISLHDVESAIFHLSIETTSPKNLTEESFENLTSNGHNKWFDKSLTICVYENSLCGVNMEHTTADGTIFSRMLEYAWAHAQYDEVGNAISSGQSRHYKINKPKEIMWNLDAINESLPLYERNLHNLCSDVDTCSIVLRHGKGAIKKCRVSPDDFMQMALQLAFYRTHKFIPKTYESASTRFFKYGRTETIRTASEHTKAFVEAMDNPDVKASEVVKILQKAIKSQHLYKLQATSGHGCDRHFFALYIMAKLKGIEPKLFQHKVIFEPDHLSTSQCPYFYDKKLTDTMSMYPSGGNFGPQRIDGYGAYYIFLGENAVALHVTSKKSHPDTNSAKFVSTVETAMLDIRSMLSKKP